MAEWIISKDSFVPAAGCSHGFNSVVSLIVRTRIVVYNYSFKVLLCKF
jgi:hypothetical protein